MRNAALDDIACFVAVVDRGSFTAAADELGVSRSAASKQVSHLESRLRARLLNRTTRRLSLTEVGEVFYESARRGLQEIGEAEAAVSRLQSAPRGVLRLNVPMSFGILHVAPALPAFLERYPEVRLEVRFDDRKLDLVEEAFDVAVRIGELAESSLVARRIAACPHVICATPAYLRRHGEPHRPDELRGHNALAFSYAEAPSQWTLTARDGKEVKVPVDGSVRMNNSLALRELLLAGVGLALTPRFVVGRDLEAGRLKAVLTDYRVREPGAFAVYPQRRHLSPKVRAFVDFIAERLATELG
ncbi:MAG TPA: LysR substrate-binding domain-containing protein [Verrucomicrobiae bacterium]|nr:LysR substrate-binding domain-containing protein [Verrucomicrobiae bacterium]